MPSHREIPGARRRRHGTPKGDGYPIDVREFLVTEDNAVLRQWLAERIAPFGGNKHRFTARNKGAFDFRADTIARWVGEHITYRSDGGDAWLFPDETLHLGAGDCEDRAILLAALLVASGVSAYNVRVAFGTMVVHGSGSANQSFDHAWAVYRREDGAWEILEPVHYARSRPVARARRASPRTGNRKIEYRPKFVFNGDHLWRVFDGTKADRRPSSFADAAKRGGWARMHPSFAGDVHWTLIHDALSEHGSEVVDAVRRSFTTLFGNRIDYPDMPWRYDPDDHFDNCRIVEGWKRVATHLDAFRQRRDLRSFGFAAHGIADFYAHTSYGHFAKRIGSGGARMFVPFDPAWLTRSLSDYLEHSPTYDSGDFDLVRGGFTQGPRWGKRGAVAAAAEWKGKLLSGRYAHVGDSQGTFEGFTWMPDEIWNQAGFDRCAAAPHHEEIAVDTKTGKNRLYGGVAFEDQFRLRYATAVFHVRQEFEHVWLRESETGD